MNLIGISGKKQSGKSTAAAFMRDILHPHKVISIGFADALKQEIATAIGQPVSFIEEHKDNFRLILQGWGTDFRRKLIRDDYWITKVLEKIVKLPNDIHTVVIPDVRFRNEAGMIKDAGGYLISIQRPTTEFDLHESERMDFPVDYEISNHSNLKELKLKIQDTLFQIHTKQTTQIKQKTHIKQRTINVYPSQ